MVEQLIGFLMVGGFAGFILSKTIQGKKIRTVVDGISTKLNSIYGGLNTKYGVPTTVEETVYDENGDETGTQIVTVNLLADPEKSQLQEVLNDLDNIKFRI